METASDVERAVFDAIWEALNTDPVFDYAACCDLTEVEFDDWSRGIEFTVTVGDENLTYLIQIDRTRT